MSNLVKNAVVGGLWAVMGRRNLVRFARLLTMESRLDAGNEIHSNGERMVQSAAATGTPPGKPVVVFDAGANIGQWTRDMLDAARAAGRSDVQVHSFEPCQGTYEILKRNLAGFAGSDRVTCVHKALSSAPGSAVLNIVGDGAGTNSLHQQAGMNAAKQETITLTTVDDYCREAAIERIALLKIDTEGHDMSVIEGAKAMLGRRAIDLVQFEYNQRWIYSRHYLLDAFSMLQPLGYRLGKITPTGIEFYKDWHYELESWREGNYLACLESWVGRFPAIRWWNE